MRDDVCGRPRADEIEFEDLAVAAEAMFPDTEARPAAERTTVGSASSMTSPRPFETRAAGPLPPAGASDCFALTPATGRNPARSRMKAAGIVDLARMLHSHASHPLRRYCHIPILVSSRRRVDDKIAARPFDCVADMSRNLGGSNVILSIATWIVSPEIAGELAAKTARRASPPTLNCTACSYFRDWATCSACISWP